MAYIVKFRETEFDEHGRPVHLTITATVNNVNHLERTVRFNVGGETFEIPHHDILVLEPIPAEVGA